MRVKNNNSDSVEARKSFLCQNGAEIEQNCMNILRMATRTELCLERIGLFIHYISRIAVILITYEYRRHDLGHQFILDLFFKLIN